MTVLHRSTASWLAIAASLLAAGSCVGPDVGDRGLGHEIGPTAVVNQVELPSLPEWSLTPSPSLTLGGEPGTPDLFRVRGAATLPDGGIAVLSQGTDELLVFEVDGSFRTTLGRQGEGPGEFENPTALSLVDTLLYVWDSSLRRVSVFHTSGNLERTVTLNLSRSGWNWVTAFLDGSFLFRQGRYDIPAVGFDQTFNRLVRFDELGVPTDTLTVPGGTFGFVPVDGAGSIQAELLGPRTLTSGGPEGSWLGFAEGHELYFVSPSLSMSMVVRWSGRNLSVTDEHRAAQRIASEAFVQELDPRERRPMRESYAAWPIAATMKAYDELRSSREGGVWIHPFTPPGEEDRCDWLVFDPDGTLSARVQVCPGTRLLEVGDDFVLAVEEDGLGVERVVRYEVIH